MARRGTQQRSDGLRELLIAERERSLKRWPSSRPDEFLVALRAGRSVVVSSAQLMRALIRDGLPHAQFCYGGADHGKTFELGERGELREVTG